MDWATRRKITYTGTIIILIVVYSLYHYRDAISPTPTCFDGKANGNENGVDCGGSCQLICESDTKPLTVEWSSFIKTQENTYDLIAYVSNKNTNSNPVSTIYKFSLIDQEGNLIYEGKGNIVAPINSSFPIISQNVYVEKKPSKVIVSLSSDKNYKTKLDGNTTLINVLSKNFEEEKDISRVYATVVNKTLDTLLNVKVDVVLFDENKNAVGVGETFIEKLEGEENKEIIWTWNAPFGKKPLTIEVYPIINPFTSNLK